MQASSIYGSTFAAAKAGLTGISGAATTHSTGSAGVDYCIGGKAYTKAQITGGTTPTTDAVTGEAITLTANQGRAVVWALDAAGAVKLVAGGIEALDDSGNFVVTPELPLVDLDALCPIAYHIVKGGSALVGTFTVGTSNWNTTGMTHTVVDVMTLPQRPQG